MLSFRCQHDISTSEGAPLIVNSSIQFRHNLERLDAALQESGQLYMDGNLRTRRTCDPSTFRAKRRHGDDPCHTPNHNQRDGICEGPNY